LLPDVHEGWKIRVAYGTDAAARMQRNAKIVGVGNRQPLMNDRATAHRNSAKSLATFGAEERMPRHEMASFDAGKSRKVCHLLRRSYFASSAGQSKSALYLLPFPHLDLDVQWRFRRQLQQRSLHSAVASGVVFTHGKTELKIATLPQNNKPVSAIPTAAQPLHPPREIPII
jgi:hypothetical protein